MADMSDQHHPQNLTQADAQAFMAANNLQPAEQTGGQPGVQSELSQARLVPASASVVKFKPPIVVYIEVAIFIALAVAELISATSKPKSTAGSSNPSPVLSVPTPEGAPDTTGFSSQAQQDVNTCSNDVAAALEC